MTGDMVVGAWRESHGKKDELDTTPSHLIKQMPRKESDNIKGWRTPNGLMKFLTEAPKS